MWITWKNNLFKSIWVCMFENIGAKDECKFFQEPGSFCVPLSTSGQNHTGSLQLCWTCNNNEETGFYGMQNIQSATYSNSDIWTWETIRLSCQILKIPLWQIMGCISQMNLEHFSGKTSGIFDVKLHLQHPCREPSTTKLPNCELLSFKIKINNMFQMMEPYFPKNQKQNCYI